MKLPAGSRTASLLFCLGALFVLGRSSLDELLRQAQTADFPGRRSGPSPESLLSSTIKIPIPSPPEHGPGSPSPKPPQEDLPMPPDEPASPQPHRLSPRLAWNQPVQERTLAAFHRWTTEFLAAPDEPSRNRLETRGLELAEWRIGKLADLIEIDPKQALALTLPESVRQALPPAFAPFLERRVRGRGSFTVTAALPQPGESIAQPLTRSVKLNGEEFRAYVYGNALGYPSRDDVLLSGIAIGRSMALLEQPWRYLPPDEIATLPEETRTAPCSVCGILPPAASPFTWFADVGGDIHAFCSAEHADEFEFEPGLKFESSRPPVQLSAFALQSAWTEGTKNLLLIRVDFSDIPGEPLSVATGHALITNVSAFFRECSYGKTGLNPPGAGSDMTATLRMPRPASHYGTNDLFEQLRSDARAAATSAGFILSRYQLDAVCFGLVPGWSWAGLGHVGSAGTWLRSSFSTGVAAHELGHNLGLPHANFWDTAEQSIIGPGESTEYGDKFDTMGSASAGQKHFNARFKSYLNWLPTTSIASVTSSGSYRVFPHDLTNSTGLRALRITKNSRTNYWVEFRQRYLSNKWLMNGAGLRWAGNAGESTLLLDTSPGSANGKDDSALQPGRTFSDATSGIHITVLGKAGTTPEALDITVYRGSFSTNLPPSLDIQASATNVSVNSTVRFTASAADPNDDPLVFAWDFGDGNSTNGAVAAYAWGASGYYAVLCTTSDMKGGTATKSLLVRVGSPSSYVISGLVRENGAPLPNVQVYVSSSKIAQTDSEGKYTLAGLAAGSYTVSARRPGYTLLNAGFTQPVRIGPNAINVHFEAVARESQESVQLVAAGSLWQYLDNGSDQGAAWKEYSFDTSSWKEGPAQLGYGDLDVATVVSYGPSSSQKYITTYFRRDFQVAQPSDFSALTLAVLRDDGVVVYLNGREVFRSNMPDNALSFTTRASNTVGGADESTFFETDVAPTLLRSGRNVLAAEVHQSSASSSDLSFDLRLTALRLPTPPPKLLWVRSGDGISLTWDRAALGWNLYRAGFVKGGTNWMRVDAPLQTNASQFGVSLPIESARQFFRLQRP